MKDKKPYALLINDIHVSKDNIPEFQKNWEEALQICRERNIPEIIIGGDLWMSRSAQTLPVLMAVRNALRTATLGYDLYVTIACGNHDKIDQEAIDSYNHIFQGYQNVEIVNDYVICDMSDDATLYVMSYFPENGSFTERLNDMIKTQSVDPNMLNVLYIHEGIRGGLAQPSDDELPTKIFESFDSVLVGHYHDRKQIPGTSILYIGASRQHNYGEDEEKGYTILYTNGSTEFVKNQVNMRYRTIEATKVDDALMAQIDEIKANPQYKLKLKIRCQSNEASTINKQALIDAGVTRVELVTEETNIQLTKSQSITTKFDKSGIKEEYKTFCHDKEIDNVEMGLQYLDKIN